MAHVIAEFAFSEPLTDEEHAKLADRVEPCLASYDVEWQRSYLSTDRLRMVCHFEAVDAEAVRLAHRSAGAPFEGIWAAELYQRE